MPKYKVTVNGVETELTAATPVNAIKVAVPAAIPGAYTETGAIAYCKTLEPPIDVTVEETKDGN